MESTAIGKFVEQIVAYLLANFRGLFDGMAAAILFLADGLDKGLGTIPFPAFAIILACVALWRKGAAFAVFTIGALALISYLGLWSQTMSTLALVIAATFVSLVLGVPLGIWSARNDRVELVVRSVLDFMQTMPAFVYLIPAAILFGLGKVPAIIATVIFAMPPAVRLTNLGVRQVKVELVEAGLAFGCTKWQLLAKVQLPNAMPSIMAGVNQTIMMSLSMVVIASMIGAGGLGDYVLRGIQRLDVGVGFEGGLGVVLLAIILDRITESFGKKPAFSLRRLMSAKQGSTKATA